MRRTVSARAASVGQKATEAIVAISRTQLAYAIKPTYRIFKTDSQFIEGKEMQPSIYRHLLERLQPSLLPDANYSANAQVLYFSNLCLHKLIGKTPRRPKLKPKTKIIHFTDNLNILQ
jgi:hypothetical protein